MIEVFYLHFATPLSAAVWQRCVLSVPTHDQDKVTRFRRWQDQHAALFSLLLLRQVLMQMGLSPDCLTHVKRTQYGRPFIEEATIDFNIAHSGAYVLCAVTPSGRVGIDIELIRPIAINDFKSFMTEDQWQALRQRQPNYQLFYEYWTLKESVIKADGRGLNIALETIHTEPSCAYVDDAVWFTHKLTLDNRYAAHVATDQAQARLRLHPLSEITDNHPLVLPI